MNPNWMPGVAALMGLALAGPASADSRDIYQRGRGNYRYEAPAGRIGFEKGYDDGLNRGRHDGDHRNRFDPRRDGKYRDGDHGYHSSYGPRYEYVRAYRTGFEQGYREGYAAYGRGGRDGYHGRDGYGRDGYGRDGYYDPRR